MSQFIRSRTWIVVSVLTLGISVFHGWEPLGNYTFAVEVAGLEEGLRNDLRPRRPVEFAFIDRVLMMVENDQLPSSLVRQIYQWARSKRPYPFHSFRFALIQRARRLGIEIEPTTPPGLPVVPRDPFCSR